MKNRLFLSVVLSACTILFMISCEPLEPSSYKTTFYRIGTIKYDGEYATLLIDYTKESYDINNLRTQSDMDKHGLSNGDRIMAELTFLAIENVSGYKVTLENYEKIDIQSFAESCPPDSLNDDYWFNRNLDLGDVLLPPIWSQGHFINLAPTSYKKVENDPEYYYLYPYAVTNDTLRMKLYSHIPGSGNYQCPLRDEFQSVLCYDATTLRATLQDEQENHLRDSLLTLLSPYANDSIVIAVTQPDSLVGTKYSNKDGKEVQYDRIPRITLSTHILFDF